MMIITKRIYLLLKSFQMVLLHSKFDDEDLNPSSKPFNSKFHCVNNTDSGDFKYVRVIQPKDL